jgi:mannose-6-phosphate isomerase-like protein (cupin superfamily)
MSKNPGTSEVIFLPPGSGRSYQAGPMRAVFKADGAETDDRYCVSEWWLESGDSGPGPHSHEDEVETFYVIEGTMSFLVGEEWLDAPRGSFLRIPGGRYPRLREPEPEPCRRAQRETPGRLRSDDAGEGRLVRPAERLGHPRKVNPRSCLARDDSDRGIRPTHRGRARSARRSRASRTSWSRSGPAGRLQ